MLAYENGRWQIEKIRHKFNIFNNRLQCISHLSVAIDFGQDSLINGAMRSIYGAESFSLICISNYDLKVHVAKWSYGLRFHMMVHQYYHLQFYFSAIHFISPAEISSGSSVIENPNPGFWIFSREPK